MRKALALALALAATPAAADDAAHRDDAAARKLYAEAIVAYDVGDLDRAIDRFQRAYALTRAPRLLFDLAQAYRLKRDWARAGYLYASYLRVEPGAPNRRDVEARIDEMDHLARARPTLVAPTVTAAPSRGRGRALRLAGPLLLGGGAILGSLGGYFVGVAVADGEQLASLPARGAVAQRAALAAETTRAQIAGGVLLGVGAAAVLGGAIVTALAYRHER